MSLLLCRQLVDFVTNRLSQYPVVSAVEELKMKTLGPVGLMLKL